ncbi:MAG: methionyl-tRNA formyltransferase [Polaribacter sp.]|nr:MAG: methionyl-tRNA formyltransferase [Polaribacter sp.]
MGKDLRIVFFGTPEFAETSLKRLVEDKYNVVGIVTVCDKPAGRGRKLHESKVKQYAKSQNLPILQPKNLKSEDFINELKALNADLFIVVAFRMLPKIVWELPKYGTFNLHTSLLPEYRGSAPINWVIINGEKQTGVTTFFIDDKIDSGEILLQREIPIADDEIFGELYDKMQHIGADLLVETVNLIANGKAKPKKQPQETTKLAPKLFSQDCHIDWTKNIDDIYNFIRGLNPYPTARTQIIDGEKITDTLIYNVSKEYVEHSFEIGCLVISKKQLKVAVNGGYIVLNDIKISGKKQMDIISFLNGYKFNSENPCVFKSN